MPLVPTAMDDEEERISVLTSVAVIVAGAIIGSVLYFLLT